MTIKQYVFRAHAYLRTQGFASLTRSQVHELLAAAAGFSAHAAFLHQAVWCDVAWGDTGVKPDKRRLIQRCLRFGMSPAEGERAAQGVATLLSTSGYAPARFEELIAALTDEEDPWMDTDEAGSNSVAGWLSTELIGSAERGIDALLERFPVLLEGLEAAAARGIAAAHLAAAHLLEPYASLSDDDDHRFGRELHRRGQWSTEPVGFAEIAGSADSFIRVVAKHRYHLLEAARGKDRRALLLTAERYGDPGALELEPSNEVDPYHMANLADANGRSELGNQWLAVLAREGDMLAMRTLIEDRSEPLSRAWVWMYLSRLLGRDLSQHRYEAICENGALYEDDIGGPAFVGGDIGIELIPLAAEDRRRAEEEAAQLFAEIEKRRSQT